MTLPNSDSSTPDLTRRTVLRRAGTALLGTTLLAGGVVIGLTAAGATSPPPIAVPETQKLPGFAGLVTVVKPAVVNISVTEKSGSLVVNSIVDSAGPSNMPIFGVETGGGGTAQASSPISPLWTVALAAAALVLLTLAWLRVARAR